MTIVTSRRPGTPPGERPVRRTGGLRRALRSSLGRKQVMAVTGLLMLAFVVAHMLGNLKIFFGGEEFDAYSHWLRTIGVPAVHEGWYLWIQRTVLTAALVLHVWAAAGLARAARVARPVGYAHRRRGGYAAVTMRWGGVVLLLFVVYHVLDLTAGVANPAPSGAGPYDRVVADVSVWYVTLAYVVAMVALGLHIGHGLWSAATTLGARWGATPRLRAVAVSGAVAITAGFLVVPFAVALGVVE